MVHPEVLDGTVAGYMVSPEKTTKKHKNTEKTTTTKTDYAQSAAQSVPAIAVLYC